MPSLAELLAAANAPGKCSESKGARDECPGCERDVALGRLAALAPTLAAALLTLTEAGAEVEKARLRVAHADSSENHDTAMGALLYATANFGRVLEAAIDAIEAQP